jgi:LPXTG-motif cell wall-anchored protein
MRSVIPTRSSRSPTGLQTAVLLGVAGLAASLWFVKSKKRNAIRAPRRDRA